MLAKVKNKPPQNTKNMQAFFQDHFSPFDTAEAMPKIRLTVRSISMASMKSLIGENIDVNSPNTVRTSVFNSVRLLILQLILVPAAKLREFSKLRFIKFPYDKGCKYHI